MAELRQCLFSYLLLAALFIVPVSALLIPSIERFTQAQQNLEQAQEQLLEARNKVTEADTLLDRYPRQFAEFVREGDLMYATSSSDATNRFQESLKPILLKHQASLSQLRPAVEVIEQGLSKSALELNLRMPIETFGHLLEDLSQMKPRIQVDSVNARRINLASNSRDLELSLRLSIWFVNRNSFPTTLKTEIDQHVLAISGTEEHKNTKSSESASVAKIELKPDFVPALFDRALRQRLLSPSMDYYSVAAITVSPKGKLALIKIVDQPGTYRITADDMLDVWMVEAIDESGVALSFNKQRKRLQWSR